MVSPVQLSTIARRAARPTGVFSVIELVTEPEQGVAAHVHQHEDELVYIIDGELEVMLGDQKMNAGAGIMALLPRGIPHGFTNVGNRPSRLLDVILPGKFDNYLTSWESCTTRASPLLTSSTSWLSSTGLNTCRSHFDSLPHRTFGAAEFESIIVRMIEFSLSNIPCS